VLKQIINLILGLGATAIIISLICYLAFWMADYQYNKERKKKN
jgi:uncharacterized membrane protein